MTDTTQGTEIADFAGGCFWGIEDIFLDEPGIISTQSGYEGGEMPKPTYAQVCSHITGHAETVRLVFDPTKTSYEKLLRKYIGAHDPTQVNRQGPDVGENYRSAIFYHSDAQKDTARRVIKEINDSGQYKDPVATEVTPATTFWPAEDLHQQFYAKRRGHIA